MENFKEKLKIQNTTYGICSTILGLFSVCSALGEADLIPFPSPVNADGHWQSMWRGFVCGASFPMLAFFLFGLARNIRALKDEKKLKKLYISETDERTIQIWTYARAAALQSILILGLVAIIISGYYSMTVSITILLFVLTSSVIVLLFKIYYNKKF